MVVSAEQRIGVSSRSILERRPSQRVRAPVNATIVQLEVNRPCADIARRTLSFAAVPDRRLSRIAADTALAAVAATAVNVLLRFLAVAVFDIPQPEFEPLQLRDVIVSSIGATVAAGIVWALIVRFAKDPAKTFRIVAAVALVLSLAAPLQVGLADPPDYPGTDAGSVGTLIAMHVVTAAIVVAVFTRRRGSGSPPR
jgi:hypothetical protein